MGIFFPLQIHYYFAKNQQTLQLIVKKYELFLPLIFFKWVIFLGKYVILSQNVGEIHEFLPLNGDFSDQNALNSR